MKDLHDDETRVTDESTGGMKGKKLTQLGALDPAALIELARVAGMGANKYAPYNYMRGYDWSLSFNAMMRHALLFWSGEDDDPESQLNHMAHAAWMALCLVSFSERGLGTDDRYVQRSATQPMFDMHWKQRVGVGHPHAGEPKLCYQDHRVFCDHGVDLNHWCDACAAVPKREP